MPYKFLLFVLIFVSNCSSSFANIEPYCNNAIPQNLLNKIDNSLPQMIDIEVLNSRKWFKHNLKMAKNSAIGVDTIISSEYKKRFKANVHVIFDDSIKCTFLAKIRQHGDFSDHLKLIDGNLFHSIDVDLINGNINGIISFILLMPQTRNNPEDEIILTELLRELDFLAPRTNFVKVKLNDFTKTMLFQEKASKEMLEYNLRREGPILEGDERHVFSKEHKNSYGYIPNQAQLSRQINAKWATKSVQHENISHEALTRLNLFYLLTKSAEHFNSTFKEHSPNLLNNNLLVQNNPNLVKKLDMYNAIIFSANGDHSLAPRNKKFYWDAINNYFEPIYYDGDLNIDRDYDSEWLSLLGFKLEDISDKESFLFAVKKAKEKINQITIENFVKKVKYRGSLLSDDKIKNKVKKILLNLDKVKLQVNSKKDSQNNNIIINDKILSDYVDYTVKWGFNIFFVYRDTKSNLFYACKNTTLICNKIKLTKGQIKSLLAGRLVINKHVHQYIGSYPDLKNDLFSINFNNGYLPKYKNFKFKNTNFYYDENTTYKFDEKNSIFNIYQKYSGARSYFLGGSLKDISINFVGLPESIDSKLENNYPFDQNGLTGCLSFIGLNFQNVSISALNSNCEDAVNFINTKGYIKKFDSKNSAGDALDIDFSNIKIDEIFINKTNNDCIDLSGGKYELNELNLSECGDKALSVGEKSYVKLNNIQVLKSTIGLSSKDSSIIYIKNAGIKDTQICLEAKRKKQEFLGGIINLNHYNCNDSPINVFSGSFINYH